MRLPRIDRIFCRTKVDLPMPGSPPMSTIEPATSPPPSTLLSSSLGICMRVSVAVTIPDMGMGTLSCPKSNVEDLLLPVTARSSTIVFHSPQPGHRPTHFDDSLPQLLQNQVDFTCFAIFFKIIDGDETPPLLWQ